MGGHPITPVVLGVLNEKFNGKAVTLDQLVAQTGRDRKVIQSAMARLVADENVACTVVTRGNMWRYDGAATLGDENVIADTLFEVVGTAAKGGDTIVRGDVSGKLYKVVAL